MGQIRLQGSLTVGPNCACDGDVFPNAHANVHLETTPCTKSSQVDTGFNRRNVNSALAYTTLSGVGATDNVTQGDTLYVRSQSNFLVRVTFNNPLGGTIVSVIPLYGTLMLEVPSTYYVSLLECQGVGFIEYLVSGQV